MPEKLTAQEELPGLTVITDLPVMGKIRLWRAIAGNKARQTGVDRMRQMLLGATGKCQGIQRLERAVISNAQCRSIFLPLAAEMRRKQGIQMRRCQLAQLQRGGMFAVFE